MLFYKATLEIIATCHVNMQAFTVLNSLSQENEEILKGLGGHKGGGMFSAFNWSFKWQSPLFMNTFNSANFMACFTRIQRQQ